MLFGGKQGLRIGAFNGPQHRTGTTSVPLHFGGTCLSGPLELRRDVLVTSVCWDSGGTWFSIQDGHDMRAPPQPEGPAYQVRRSFGGMCLSRPCVGTREAPGSLYRTGTTSVPLHNRRDLLVRSVGASEGRARHGRVLGLGRHLVLYTGRARQACPSTTGGTCLSGPLELRRDVLVTSVCWDSGGTWFSMQNGHDKRAPPQPEGPACQVRWSFGGTCLSRPCVGTREAPGSPCRTGTLRVHHSGQCMNCPDRGLSASL